ncbi:hypothetical protein [Cytophaga aurantiaca]|uniref:hypothetical protein n=1 Tax=Cytophaga aurantiaca TaxID=29530 RepID=UPI000376FF80|nr:hypothetical protein [Cytophaga aurantiaca]
MKSAVQNKIDSLIEMSEKNSSNIPSVNLNVNSNNDSLSKAIRTKRDADIFRNELEAAIRLSKEK